MKLCTKFNDNPSNSDGDISLKTTNEKPHGGARNIQDTRPIVLEIFHSGPVLAKRAGGGRHCHPSNNLQLDFLPVCPRTLSWHILFC